MVAEVQALVDHEPEVGVGLGESYLVYEKVDAVSWVAVSLPSEEHATICFEALKVQVRLHS